MTGFGQAQAEDARRRVDVTVQGWNHRSLDLVVRLPEELRSLEPAVRERATTAARRGRCEVAVRVASIGERHTRVRLDREALRALGESARELAATGWVEPRITMGELLRSPQLLTVEPEPDDWSEVATTLFLETVERALVAFGAARSGEGGRLGAVLERGRTELAVLVDQLEVRRGTAAERIESSLRSRLDELVEGGFRAVPAERLAQEVALLIDRGDVREEIDRLRAHLEHFAEITRSDEPVGKRLDFLAQEILRELNTFGAKSRDHELTRLVVDAKVVCEQLREQIQNVE